MTAFSTILLFCLLLLLTPLDAYRRGDVIDTVLLTKDASGSTILQKDMPLFATASTSVVKKVPSLMFSLGFEDGLYMLPWIRNERLEKLLVIISYSGGSIHSVSSRVVTSRERPDDDSFEIEYQWIEEAPLDIKTGISVMFLVTLVISIIFLIQACDTTSSNEYYYDDSDDQPPSSRRRRGQHRE